MAKIVMIMPDGSIEESHCLRKRVDQATLPQVFAWIADQISMRGEMQIGEAILVAKTKEGWRVHGPVDYQNLIDRLETVTKEAAADGK